MKNKLLFYWAHAMMALSLFAGCVNAPMSQTPAVVPKGRLISEAPQKLSHRFRLNSVQADEPAAAQLSTVIQPPQNPDFELRFLTEGTAPNSILIPKQDSFRVIVEVGNSFSIVDADGTDGSAKFIVPAGVMDFYLKPEKLTPPICQNVSNPSEINVLDYLGQTVIDKANQLINQGKSQCVYLPPSNQQHNGSCNSTSQGLSCSGSLNKSIQIAQCPEIAVVAGNMNINHTMNSKMFVAVQNNLKALLHK